MWASIAWRLFWRELKRGELWVMPLKLTTENTAKNSAKAIDRKSVV